MSAFRNNNQTNAAKGGYERGKGELTASEPKGAFRPDGSYDPDIPVFMRKGTDRLVRHLVGKRQKASISPQEAVSVILEAGGSKAFPNAPQWASTASWPLAVAETSAEAAVKYCGGRSEDMHWCGDNWIVGKQKECSNPDHWRQTSPEEAARFFDTLRRAFG